MPTMQPVVLAQFQVSLLDLTSIILADAKDASWVKVHYKSFSRAVALREDGGFSACVCAIHWPTPTSIKHCCRSTRHLVGFGVDLP